MAFKIKDRREQRIDEFCAKARMESHREILTQILDDLTAQGVTISAREDVEFSNYEAYPEQGKHIRISLKNVKIPLDVIWILFHEFGHFQSGDIKSTDTVIGREELAWNYADATFKTYPELNDELESYETCKLRCLSTYYKKYKG